MFKCLHCYLIQMRDVVANPLVRQQIKCHDSNSCFQETKIQMPYSFCGPTHNQPRLIRPPLASNFYQIRCFPLDTFQCHTHVITPPPPPQLVTPPSSSRKSRVFLVRIQSMHMLLKLSVRSELLSPNLF